MMIYSTNNLLFAPFLVVGEEPCDPCIFTMLTILKQIKKLIHSRKSISVERLTFLGNQ